MKVRREEPLWGVPNNINYDEKADLLLHIKNIEVTEDFITEKCKFPNLSEDNKFIFVHIPKCAGNSINNVLKIKGRREGHRSLSDIQKILDKDIYENAVKFTVVRNPFERAVSLYSFRQNIENWIHNPPYPFAEGHTFEEWFWDFNIQCINRFHPPRKVGMVENIKDNSNKIGVDFILRYENLGEDWVNMFNTLNIEVPKLPLLNISSHTNYRDYYKCESGDKMIETIYKLYEDDCNFFKYKF
mgnify:CR=1 FL=1